YLNGTAVLSFIIPFLSLDLFRNLVITEKVREISMVPMEVVYQPVIISSEPSATTPADVLTLIYLTGAGFFLVRLLVQLSLLRKAIRDPQNSAFSFFRILTVAPGLEQRETILQHEQVHARQWHSFDVILMEVLIVINWFNPVIYLYRTEIKHIHEFIADEETSGDSKENYAMLLLSNTFGIPAHQLTNSFFNQSLLKRRIHMLSKHRSQRTKLLKYGLCAPVFSFMLILSSAAVSKQATELADTGSDLITRTEARKSNNHFVERNPGIKGVRWSEGATVLEVLLKNGKTDRYELANPADMEKLTAAYGIVPVPPPAVPYEDTIPGALPEDYKQFLKNNPAVERLGWKNRAVIITLKNGRTEHYDLDSEAAMKRVRNKYGQLPAAPPPPPQRSNTRNAGPQDDLYGFASVEQLPKFPGGDEQFGKYLAGNLRYPAEAKEKHIAGRVFVSFIVEKDGALTDIKVLRGLGYGTDEEAVRVLKASPKWTPGMKEGKKVRVQFTIPIFFQLEKPEQPAAESKGNPDEAIDLASVDQLPRFPGGDEGFSRFLAENIRYPADAKAKNIQGKV
ncbi:MAG TPA: M56 family metallopeptidase, partial [Sphingobacteriaceae bacterium]